MHFVGHVDWSFADDPMPASDRSQGLARKVLVGPEQGAVHTELAVGALHPGGWLQRHVHSYEEALYVLDGELLLEHDGRVHRLVPGDYALNALGMWHGLGNDSDVQARWLSVNTPQRLGPTLEIRPVHIEQLLEAIELQRQPASHDTLRSAGACSARVSRSCRRARAKSDSRARTPTPNTSAASALLSP